jgi:hypothetical protein
MLEPTLYYKRRDHIGSQDSQTLENLERDQGNMPLK